VARERTIRTVCVPRAANAGETVFEWDVCPACQQALAPRGCERTGCQRAVRLRPAHGALPQGGSVWYNGFRGKL